MQCRFAAIVALDMQDLGLNTLKNISWPHTHSGTGSAKRLDRWNRTRGPQAAQFASRVAGPTFRAMKGGRGSTYFERQGCRRDTEDAQSAAVGREPR